MVDTERGFASVVASAAAAAASNAKGADQFDYSSLVEQVRATFKTGKTKKLAWRRKQLEAMKQLLIENHEAITLAVRADHKGAKLRGLAEIGAVEKIDYALANLDKWAAPDYPGHNSLVGKSYVRKEPKGVVLIISPWNYPIALALEGMVCVLAAGNCLVLKPSEVAVNSTALLAELIPKYFDNDCIKVVTGGVDETTALLRERFNHILYTGNGFVGRIVMKAAAAHLTPCTLELGGKSPVYIDRTAKINTAVCRIALFKFLNAGQTCIAPDYVLIHEDVMDIFVEKMLEHMDKHFTGDNLAENQYGRLINGRHVERVRKLLEQTKGKVIKGGEVDMDANFIAPTIIQEPDLSDSIMKEEIFGPLLPIIRVSTVKEAITKINSICESPLALYVFSETQSTIDYVLDSTSSGGVSINAVLEHATNIQLPFGGIGESGMGYYHGQYGFNEFSHFRSIMIKDTTFLKDTFPFPPPPYKDNIYDLAFKMNVTGFLTPIQRTIFKVAGIGLLAYVLQLYFPIIQEQVLKWF